MGCLFLHPLVIIELCSKDDCTHVVGSSLIPNAKERRSARSSTGSFWASSAFFYFSSCPAWASSSGS